MAKLGAEVTEPKKEPIMKQKPGDHVELGQQEPREEGGRPPTEAPSPLSSGQCSRPPRLLLYPLAIASPRMGHCEASTL